MSKQRQFNPDQYDADLYPDFKMPEGFIDISWKNDVCPSIANYRIGLKIWIAETDKEARELWEMDMFSVQPEEGGEDLLTTNDFSEVEAFLKEYRESLKEYHFKLVVEQEGYEKDFSIFSPSEDRAEEIARQYAGIILKPTFTDETGFVRFNEWTVKPLNK